jgi:hypothetical protein
MIATERDTLTSALKLLRQLTDELELRGEISRASEFRAAASSVEEALTYR